MQNNNSLDIQNGKNGRDIQNGTKGSNRRHHLKMKIGITALMLAGVLAFGGCAANAGASLSDTAVQSAGSAEGVSTSGTSGTESKSANTVSIKDDYYAAVNAGVLIIGSNATTLPGVTIGEGSIIGAGSVVTKDIPENVIAAGNPCRVIRAITEQDRLKG